MSICLELRQDWKGKEKEALDALKALKEGIMGDPVMEVYEGLLLCDTANS